MRLDRAAPRSESVTVLTLPSPSLLVLWTSPRSSREFILFVTAGRETLIMSASLDTVQSSVRSIR